MVFDLIKEEQGRVIVLEMNQSEANLRQTISHPLSCIGIGSDVMKPIAASIVGGMVTSTVHVLILVPVFFVMMKERALRKGSLRPSEEVGEEPPRSVQAFV